MTREEAVSYAAAYCAEGLVAIAWKTSRNTWAVQVF